jgi:galactose-1-phosphate uridylyltransferase
LVDHAEESRGLAALKEAGAHGLFGFELPYMLVVLEAPRDADDWHLAVELYPPHRSERLTKVRASVETATLLFINDTLPEENAASLRAVPVVARQEHPGFVVVPAGEIPA